MATKVKDRFNSFLDGNTMMNSLSELKDEIKKVKKGKIGYLLSALLIGSVSTLLLSFIASVFGYGDSTSYLIIVCITNVISVMINNIVFTCFLKSTSDERVSLDDVAYFVKKFVPQILCVILLSIGQMLVSRVFLQVTAYIPTLNVVISIAVSLFFTMMNALVAFCIFVGVTKVREILPQCFTIITRNAKVLIIISVLFVCWSYVCNVAFTNMLYAQLQQTQGINNIFHALLQQHDYMNLLKVSGFYGINYIIGGFLEIDILIALALLYKKDKKRLLKK